MAEIASYLRLLKSQGIPLTGLGVDEVAMNRPDTLKALEHLKRATVGILGGDVYLKRGDRIDDDFFFVLVLGDV
jgi:hypothetical protein